MVNGVQSTKITVDEDSEIDTVKTNNIGELSIEGKGTVRVINPDDLSKVDVSHLLSNPNITPPGGKRSGGSSGGKGSSSSGSSKPSDPDTDPSNPSDPSNPDKPPVTDPEKPTDIKTATLSGLKNLTTKTAQSAKVTTSDTGYSVEAVTWKKGGTDVTDWETATAGEYTASITLTVDSKHHFDNPTVKLDGSTVSNVTISDDNKTLTFTVPMQLAETLPAKLSNLSVTIPSSNQGSSQNSVVVDETGTSIDVSVDVENAVEGSKVKFIISPVGSTKDDMNFTGGSTEGTDIVATVDINGNSANATLNITKAQKTNFTIKAQYVDEKGTPLSDTEKAIDVTVINNPIDYIIVDSVSATPVVDEVPDIGAISVEVEANKGYTVTSVEWGKIENNAYEILADSTFVAGTTYAVKATLEVDSRLSGVSFAGAGDISVQGAGAGGYNRNFTNINGGTLEIVFSVGEAQGA